MNIKNFEIRGKITEITEPKQLDNGAKVLEYHVMTDEDGEKEYFINYYCGSDKLEFMDKFLEYNKVGDTVDVIFSIRSNKGVSKAGRPYKMNPLTHFKCSKVESDSTTSTMGQTPSIEPEEEEDLPF